MVIEFSKKEVIDDIDDISLGEMLGEKVCLELFKRNWEKRIGDNFFKIFYWKVEESK